MLLSGSTVRYSSFNYKPPDVYSEIVFLERRITTAKNYVRKHINAIKELNPDVLIINNSPFVMAALPFIPWEIIRIPVIHKIIEEEVKSYLAMNFWWDRAVCVSPLIEKVSKGLPGSAKLHVCPLGIITNNFYNVNQKKRIRKRPLSLIWVGRVIKTQKRADLIPCIAHELNIRDVSYQCTILGVGSELRNLKK